MPGDNCSIYGCTVSRRSKYKGISLFKVPSSDKEFETRWRDQLVVVITKDREVDPALPSPSLNLPVKSIPSSTPKPRESSNSVLLKRSLPAIEGDTDRSTECYKSFAEFNSRISTLKLKGWQINSLDNVTHITQNDQIHSVPKYEIFVNDQLSYTVRVLL